MFRDGALKSIVLIRRILRFSDSRVLPYITFRLFKGRAPCLEGAKKLLFVCEGNICRSPFAEAYAKTRLQEYLIESSGLAGEVGRVSPKEAISAASLYNIDLCGHSARALSEDQIREADLIFAMDARNCCEFIFRFPQYAPKLYLLGVYEQILDPYGRDSQCYAKVYNQITRSIEALIARRDVPGN